MPLEAPTALAAGSLTAEAPTTDPTAPPTASPILAGRRPLGTHLVMAVFVLVPTVAAITAVPLAWGWGVSWLDLGLALVFYVISVLGVTVGYHRYFTHRGFKTGRVLRTALAIAGSLALQGDVITWVADHRRHHAFSDREGDPHSPWLHGTGARGLARGLWHAHMGWLFGRDETNLERFAPDLIADRDTARVSRQFPLWSAVSLGAPALLGGLLSVTWWGAFTGFFWAGLVRVAASVHVTWSINSICHMFGRRPFAGRDRATNFWPLAVLSFGESWHNLHHADPTSARHGVLPGQIDISARVIWVFEKLGLVWDVRWPTTRRLARLAAAG